MKESEEVLEPEPLQFNYPDPNWETPRNFHDIGYSPFSMGLATPVDTPEAPNNTNKEEASSENPRSSRTIHNSGPTVLPHILDIALAFSGRRPARKIAEVDGTEPPSHNTDGRPKKRPNPLHSDVRLHAIPQTTSSGLPTRAKAPPNCSGLPPHAKKQPSSSGFPSRVPMHPSSSGLPPRGTVGPSTHIRNHEHVDPLLHKSIVMPPCPILPEEEFDRPVEQRRYTHVSAPCLISVVS
jgi:hypothetical protein